MFKIKSFFNDKKLILKILVIFSIALIGEGFALYAESRIGYSLKPASYGDYKVTYSLITIIGVILLFGMDRTIIKEVPLMLKQHRNATAKGIIYQFAKVAVYSALGWAMLNLFFRFLLAKTGYTSFHPGILYLAVASLYGLYYFGYKATRAIDLGYQSILIYYSSNLFLTVGIVLYASQLSLSKVIQLLALSLFLPTLIYIVCILNHQKSSQVEKISVSDYFDFKHNLIYLEVQLIDLFFINALTLLVEFLPLAEAKVGIIASVFSTCSLINIGVLTLRTIFTPQISAIRNESRQKIRRLQNRIFWVSLVFIVSMLVLTMASVPFFYDIYGLEYAEGLHYLPLALLTFLSLPFQLGVIGFIGNDPLGNHYLGAFYLVLTTTSLLLSAVLVLCLGIIGALYGLLVFSVAKAAGIRYINYKILNSERYFSEKAT